MFIDECSWRPSVKDGFHSSGISFADDYKARQESPGIEQVELFDMGIKPYFPS